MTDDMTLFRTLEADPVEVEGRLTAVMRMQARQITSRPTVARALIVADQLRDGYVISTEEQGREVADLVAQVIDGERDLTEQVGLALRIPKAMEKAVRESVGMVKDRLERARLAGNAARLTWQTTVRRRAAEAEAKARQEAAEEAKRAAAEAAVTGEDVPPPAEVAPVEVPKTVSGGTGKMGIAVRIQAVQIVDQAACPDEWRQLVPAIALREFALDVAKGLLKKPEPGTSLVWKGVRFEAVEGVVNRR